MKHQSRRRITFNHYISNDFDFKANNVDATTAFISDGYYFIINDGSWKVGDILTEGESGIWSGTISNLRGGLFALISSVNVSPINGHATTTNLRKTYKTMLIIDSCERTGLSCAVVTPCKKVICLYFFKKVITPASLSVSLSSL